MDTDELEPRPQAPKPVDLETLSIEELERRIEALEAEIARIQEVIAAKQAHRGEADTLFPT